MCVPLLCYMGATPKGRKRKAGRVLGRVEIAASISSFGDGAGPPPGRYVWDTVSGKGSDRVDEVLRVQSKCPVEICVSERCVGCPDMLGGMALRCRLCSRAMGWAGLLWETKSHFSHTTGELSPC